MQLFDKKPAAYPDITIPASEQQTQSRVCKNFSIVFFTLLINVLIGWSPEIIAFIFEFIFEFLHLVFEFFEYSLELLLQNTLYTSHQQSEIIIFNSTIIISLLIGFKVYLNAPQLSLLCKSKCRTLCFKAKTRQENLWLAIPLLCKIKFVSAFSFSCLLFLLTL